MDRPNSLTAYYVFCWSHVRRRKSLIKSELMPFRRVHESFSVLDSAGPAGGGGNLCGSLLLRLCSAVTLTHWLIHGRILSTITSDTFLSLSTSPERKLFKCSSAALTTWNRLNKCARAGNISNNKHRINNRKTNGKNVNFGRQTLLNVSLDTLN